MLPQVSCRMHRPVADSSRVRKRRSKLPAVQERSPHRGRPAGSRHGRGEPGIRDIHSHGASQPGSRGHYAKGRSLACSLAFGIEWTPSGTECARGGRDGGVRLQAERTGGGRAAPFTRLDTQIDYSWFRECVSTPRGSSGVVVCLYQVDGDTGTRHCRHEDTIYAVELLAYYRTVPVWRMPAMRQNVKQCAPRSPKCQPSEPTEGAREHAVPRAPTPFYSPGIWLLTNTHSHSHMHINTIWGYRTVPLGGGVSVPFLPSKSSQVYT